MCDHAKHPPNGWKLWDGCYVLVGADYGMIAGAIEGFEGAGERSDVFGKGEASERMCEVLRNVWGTTTQ